MNPQTIVVLKKIILDYSDILYDTRKFKAYMRDFQIPKIDINLLSEIMNSPTFLSFISSKENYSSTYEKKKLLNELKQEYPFDEQLLSEGIDCFIFAFSDEKLDKFFEKPDDETENKLVANVIKFMLYSD